MTTLPTESTTDVATFKLLVADKDITYEYDILSLSVRREVNRVPTARVVLRDGSAAEETFAASEGDDLLPGKKIKIAMGYDTKDQPVFQGGITKQSIKVDANGDSTLTLECKEAATKLTIGRHSRYFTDSKDSDAISTILGDYSDLSPEVSDTQGTHPEIVQHYATDWDFILSRAEMNGQIVLVEGDKFKVKAPTAQGDPIATLTYGVDLLSLEADMDARYQYKAVKAKAWSYADQALIEADGAEPTVNKQGNLSGSTLADTIGLSEWELRHSGQVLQPELQAWADAQLLKSRLAKIQALLKLKGYPGAQPDTLIKLQGVGKRFNGLAYVSGVRHDMTGGTWHTYLQLGLSPQWFYQEADQLMEKPAAGLLPGVSGLQIGVVVQLQDDPNGEDRILVKSPIIDPDAKGIWARVATLDAGNNRGSFFRPEIDDEVVLGFLNDDPRDPIVLGMLNSSAKPAPLDGSDENHHKGFFTRSELKVTFDDDQKIITLETPGGNKVTLSDAAKGIALEDQNGNTVTLNDSGIEIKSPKDITLEATGKLTLKATQDASLEGLNVNVKANAQFKAEGSAGAEVSTGAIAILKGSLVQIN
ncbi:MAG: type VI secretion system tip protein VgrG [Leptolyngbyaceae cyanobacterium MO_188.B28]|nr:type VI secretion system tip protein VgrG [Leptolyngbyaceae cyanobacterium MO_188.B28]